MDGGNAGVEVQVAPAEVEHFSLTGAREQHEDGQGTKPVTLGCLDDLGGFLGRQRVVQLVAGTLGRVREGSDVPGHPAEALGDA